MEDNNLEINEINPASPDFRTDLAEKIADLAPEAVADGKIDFEKLKELLSDDVSNASERFGLFWPGKKNAIRQAQTPTTATLKPDFENSKDWDNTENVFIEGDNLEVLKILQNHYYGKIKMIYIDPPYNTGKDFVYKDNFRDGIKTYKEWTQQIDEDGKALSSNADTDGRYHSNWLNMMYPRLKLARNLLTNDGAIFISIDEKEVTNLQRTCDEIFGENNFLGKILWKKKSNGTNLGVIPPVHDYILVYARDSKTNPIIGRPVTQAEIDSTYSNPDNDPKGPWTTMDLAANHEGPWFEIKNPKTGTIYTPPEGRFWVFNETEVKKRIADGRIIFGKTGLAGPIQKKYLADRGEIRRAVDSWWDDVELNSDGQKQLSEITGAKKVLDHPKPIGLIQKAIQSLVQKDEGDIILDFFAGSATTAHATMALNAEDSGNRKFIMVQLPEPTSEKSNARKAGYSKVSDISLDRIRRAGDSLNIFADNERNTQDSLPDTGFRAYRLTDTNFAKWNLSSHLAQEELRDSLFNLAGSSDDAAHPADLFTELILKQGLSLTEHFSTTNISGLNLQSVIGTGGEFAVLAYLDEHTPPSLGQLREIIETMEWAGISDQ